MATNEQLKAAAIAMQHSKEQQSKAYEAMLKKGQNNSKN